MNQLIRLKSSTAMCVGDDFVSLAMQWFSWLEWWYSMYDTTSCGGGWGSGELKFLAFGDMGRAPGMLGLCTTFRHYRTQFVRDRPFIPLEAGLCVKFGARWLLQPGSISVIGSLTEPQGALYLSNVDSLVHIGDLGHATGFSVEWDVLLELISPSAPLCFLHDCNWRSWNLINSSSWCRSHFSCWSKSGSEMSNHLPHVAKTRGLQRLGMNPHDPPPD